jgi:hypothetical protein
MGLYRILTEIDTPLSITDICFIPLKNQHMFVEFDFHMVVAGARGSVVG